MLVPLRYPNISGRGFFCVNNGREFPTATTIDHGSADRTWIPSLNDGEGRACAALRMAAAVSWRKGYMLVKIHKLIMDHLCLVLYSNVLSLLKRNNGACWHVCKVGSDVWMEYFAVPHTLAADHIIPCYWGHVAQEWCDAFGRLFLTLKQTNVCILTVETYIQGSTWLQVNILSIQVATQQAAALVALRPSFCLFVFLLVGGVVVYVSITTWVLLSKASTCTCLVWGKHPNLSYYLSILNPCCMCLSGYPLQW